MKITRLLPLLLPLLLAEALAPTPGICAPLQQGRMALANGWSLQSSEKVSDPGNIISSRPFKPEGWYGVSVPTTVVAALMKQGVYPNPDFGMNLRKFPGMFYPIGENASDFDMPADSPFSKPWWYRKSFVLPADYRGKTIWLKFEGINYRANIWVNGQQIGNTSTVAGAWRAYEFDITGLAHPGAENVVAVEVFAAKSTDLAVTFVDWNPMPPDRAMGIFRDVSITTSGPVTVRYPAVASQVNSPKNDRAALTVTAVVRNASDHAVSGKLNGSIGSVRFSKDVELAAGETRSVTFDPGDFPQLNFSHPRLWWPAQMGSPNLYTLRMEFSTDGKVSDAAQSHFGIREITSEVTGRTSRVFRINGKKILIRGGGWAIDLMLRENSTRLNEELDYVQDMGLNTIRLEGRPVTQEFYDQADRRGILVLAGWSCCDFWEKWPKWTSEDHAIAAESMKMQMLRLRSHPSLLAWLNGSDNAPPAGQEKVYLDIEKQYRWPNPTLSSATAKLSSITGENGVRMTGPYDYVAPSYWLEDSEQDQPSHTCDLGGCGGAHGFNAETSPGPAVPTIESLRLMFGKDHLWPIDAWWSYHGGGGVFSSLDIYNRALNARYGTAANVQDYALKSQLTAYEGIRAMYEGYSRNKYSSTGVIQWMINNAWPSVIWHLYDYYLRPGGGYFGAKLALQPLHPMYSYNDHSIWVVSSQYHDASDLKLNATLYNLDMTKQFSRTVDANVKGDESERMFTLPDLPNLSSTYFLRLVLKDARGEVAGSNFYWLSTKPDVSDWKKSTWYYTPITSYADFTALSSLPKVRLQVKSYTEKKQREEITHVTIQNPSKSLAFFVRLKIDKGPRGPEILPVLWQDNYISLLPGEQREITASFSVESAGSAKPTVKVTGWNVQ